MSDQYSKTIRFTFLCDCQERRLISLIAERLNRSQGDAIRYLLQIASREIKEEMLVVGSVPNSDHKTAD